MLSLKGVKIVGKSKRAAKSARGMHQGGGIVVSAAAAVAEELIRLFDATGSKVALAAAEAWSQVTVGELNLLQELIKEMGRAGLDMYDAGSHDPRVLAAGERWRAANELSKKLGVNVDDYL